jgi:hypothetical protein
MAAARRARAGARSATLGVLLAGILKEVGLGPPVGARDERPWLCPAERPGGRTTGEALPLNIFRGRDRDAGTLVSGMAPLLPEDLVL